MNEIFWVGPENVGVGVWKFVRVGEEFRFFDLDHFHRSAVRDEELPRVQSAGIVGIFDGGKFRCFESHSVTLSIRGDDTERLSKALRMRPLN